MEAAPVDPVIERLRTLKEQQKAAKAHADLLKKEMKRAKKAIQKTKGMAAEDLFAAAGRAEAAQAATASR